MAERESSLAVLVDFENMARPGAKGRGDFDIHLVLDRLADKGRVLVKRAYADWNRYRDARHELQSAGLGLIEMPSAREGAKNRADIQMAVDAMEIAYSREHVDSFVIVSGDSDFTPLVGKLRELNKRVTGVGNRESASLLLVANCDEFIYYDNLVTAAKRSSARGGGGQGPDRAGPGDPRGAAARGDRMAARERRQGHDAPQVPGLRRERPGLLDLLEVPGGRRASRRAAPRDRPAQRHIPRGARGRGRGGHAAAERTARRGAPVGRRRRAPAAPATPRRIRVGRRRDGRRRPVRDDRPGHRRPGRRRGLRGGGQSAGAGAAAAAADRGADLLRGHDHARAGSGRGRGPARGERPQGRGATVAQLPAPAAQGGDGRS